MDGHAWILFLRLVHVVAGVFWVGAMAVIAWFLIPAAQAMGPQGGALLRRVLLDQRLSLYLIGSMGATLVSGGMLYGRLVGLGGAEWASSRFGVAYAAGAAASLLAVLLRFTVGIRTQNRMAAVGAEMQAAVGPPPPALAAEMGTLQRRSARIAGTSATLLLLAAAAMAVARYL